MVSTYEGKGEGQTQLSRGLAPLPPRFARRPLRPVGGEAIFPDNRKLSIPPNIQAVRCPEGPGARLPPLALTEESRRRQPHSKLWLTEHVPL